MRYLIIGMLAAALAGPAWGQLVDTRTDTDGIGAAVNGSLDPNEYGPGNSYVYRGGGGGFGGTLGNGALYMNSDALNLYVGFQPGNDVNDNVVILLDTKAGGFTDDTAMNDVADPGRNLSSNLTRDVQDNFGIAADYSVVIGSFGIVVFELNAGNTPGHLAFVQYEGAFTGNNPSLIREIAIPLASLAIPGGVATPVDFFAAYGSDTNFMSDETIPVQTFTGGGNLGFDNLGSFNAVNWSAYDRFVTAPEPSALVLLAVGGLALVRRRR